MGRNLRSFSGLLAVLPALYATYMTYHYRWVCDDAFITFRYSRNLARGLGPVFNIEEKVEGYTNFLWMAFLALPEYFNFDLMLITDISGILFYAGILLFIFLISRSLNPSDGIANAVPVAMIGYAFHKHGWIYATSGLETSFFMFLLLAGYYFMITARNLYNRQIAVTLLVLSAMTRPDGLLYLGMGIVYNEIKAFKESRNISLLLKDAFLTNLPVILIFIPYWIWRYNYYGWLFPNTYYAKSGDLSYWKQGIRYTFLYFKSYWLLLILLLSIPVYLAGKLNEWRKLDNKTLAFFILLLIPSVISIFYYTKIGGGFMFARFLIPATPLMYLMIEYTLTRLTKRSLHIFILLFIITGSVMRYDPYKNTKIPSIHGVFEEFKLYNRAQIKSQKIIFEKLQPYFKNARISFYGSQAMIAYFLDPYYALEATTGLTDEYLAHKSINARGQTGHEKNASREYLRERNINIDMKPVLNYDEDDFSLFMIKGLYVATSIIQYDNAIMEPMSEIDLVQFVNFPEYLDHYIRSMDLYPLSKIRSDYRVFKDYYFDNNNDPVREKHILSRI